MSNGSPLKTLVFGATMLTGIGLVHAQNAGRYVLPPLASDITGSVSAPISNQFTFSATPAAPSMAISTLYRFPADGRQLRFDTENGWRDLPVYIRASKVDEPSKLRIRYMNSVAVMPEASKLTVQINDHPIIETNIEAATEPGLLEVPIPPGTFEPGYNSVKIIVQQRHRVDCAIEAVNELWTQVDLAASGIVMTSPNDQISRLEDLTAVPLGADGALPIIVHLPQGADTAAIDRAVRATQALAIRLGVKTPKITFTREVTNTPGIHLLIGTTAELRSRGIEVSPYGDTAATVSGRAGGVAQVGVSGATLADIDESIARLASEKPIKAEAGSPQGLRALAAQNGYPLGSEGSVSLRDAGISSQEFSGRLFRVNFNIVMPADFYPADNGKATLYLDGGYVPGLVNTNEALVRINGRVVGASRLSKATGETLHRRAIETSLKSLQPGFNTISLEVRTASEGDKDCNPLSLLDNGNRLVISDQTSFAVPRIARATHLPSISTTTSTGFPLTSGAAPVTLYLPKPDLASLGAATAFLARSAVSAGKVIPVKLVTAPPDAKAGNALIVGAASDVPADLMAHFGFQKDDLPAFWTKKTIQGKPAVSEPLRPQRAALEPDRTILTGANPPTAPLRGPRTQGVDDAAAEIVIPDTFLQKSMTGLAAFLQRNVGYSPDQLTFLNGGKAAFAVNRHSRILIAQAESPMGRGASWHLLLAPDAATLQRDIVALVSPSSWTQLAGKAVALDPAEQEVSVWQTNSNYYYRLDDWSMSNVTLFAAGWLSNNIQYYVLVILSMCGIFGVFTRLILNRIGTRA